MTTMGNHQVTARRALRFGVLIALGFVSMGSVCVSPQPPLQSDPHYCGGPLAQDPHHDVICDLCVSVAGVGEPCSPDLCDPSASVVRCQPGKGLRCDPMTMTCVSGQKVDEACSATAPCIEESYCFYGSSAQCASTSPSDPWSILNPSGGAPPPDRCLPWVADGGACDSTWDAPGCLPCTPGLTCDAADHTCKRACTVDSDCPSSGSHCAAGFCAGCVDHGGSCSVGGTACCHAADQCTASACCQPTGSACSADGDCCVGAACSNGTCHLCGVPGEPCCGGGQCGGGAVCGGSGACVACGGAGEACCGGSQCGNGLACSAGSCTPCGGAEQPCCGGSQCGNGLACSAGSCTPCGGAEQPCCATGTACADPATVCASGHCVPCGTPPEACCAGSHCVGSSACQSGTCASCGGSGEPCCGGQCASPLACHGGQCVTCGGVGGPCCAGGACSGNAVCEGGTCQPCGQTFEACCAGSACIQDASQARLCVNNICASCGNDGQQCCFGDSGCAGALGCCSGTYVCKQEGFCP